MFLHTKCQQFCQTSEPCSNPCFSPLFNGQWREGAGGGIRRGWIYVWTRISSPIKPAQIILFNPLHCNEKFIHAAGNHHWSRQNIPLIRTELNIQMSTVHEFVHKTIEKISSMWAVKCKGILTLITKKRFPCKKITLSIQCEFLIWCK
jgi:hypothetical protein